jgi:hypothetical protein
VDFGLMAAKEISNHRGDAGDMNMQLALAAAARRIYGHSDLVSQQLTARGVSCCAREKSQPRNGPGEIFMPAAAEMARRTVSTANRFATRDH